MRSRSSFKNLFSRDRKTLYIVLSIVMLSVLTLTVVYAALSTTLNINGNAEVTAANWDIYLDNVQLNNNSATTNIPTITDSKTATFSTTLSKPGDYYMFTVDVVNNGTIDAMIESITKTPELSETQKKYLNYVIEYQNGESITTKQLVSKKSFARLKVKVEFRKDLTVSDLPTQSETLNLSFKVNYIQSDDSSDNVTIDNNGKLIKIISGDYDTVGSEICIGTECFYVISSDEDSVTMLAKYNLYVGNYCTGSSSSSCTPYGEEATGIQDSTMLGWISDQTLRKGTTKFSESINWPSDINSGTYVYNENSVLYNYIENYKTYIENQDIIVKEARPIKIEELEKLGCDKTKYSCSAAAYWVYSTTYWTGAAYNSNRIWTVDSNADLDDNYNDYAADHGIRPVITIPKS